MGARVNELAEEAPEMGQGCIGQDPQRLKPRILVQRPLLNAAILLGSLTSEYTYSLQVCLPRP
jgi:hypothetical protein